MQEGNLFVEEGQDGLERWSTRASFTTVGHSHNPNSREIHRQVTSV